MPAYRPYPVAVVQDDQGRWQVTFSVSPWQRVSVIVIMQGITPEHAIALAVTALPVLTGKGSYP